MRLIYVVISILVVSVAYGGTDNQQTGPETDAVAELFQAEGIDGTQVVASSDGEVFHVHNGDRSEERFSESYTIIRFPFGVNT